MSMETNIEYGYGVITSEIKITDVKKLEALIHLAPKYEKEIKTYFSANDITEPTVEDYLEYEEDYRLAAILSNVIEERQRVGLYTCSDEWGRDYLLYLQMYPWYMKRFDRRMTPKKISKLFNKYLAYITDREDCVDYQRCEYCS